MKCDRCDAETDARYELLGHGVCDPCSTEFNAWYRPWWKAGQAPTDTEGEKP